MALGDTISKHTCNVGVIGLGHVGLTVAAVFADKGFAVFGCDVIPQRVKGIMSQNLKLSEFELAEIVDKAVKCGKLSATTNCSGVTKSCEIVILCVQTPVTRNHQPDLSFLRSATNTVGQALKKGSLVLIMSSVPPGTTKKMLTLLETTTGLTCGKDFWLAYVPERLAPGRSVQDFINNRRIIGTSDAQSARLARRLLQEVVNGEIFSTDVWTAEIVKLAENTFRDVNIAFANELALVCEQHGVDVQEVIKLANTHHRVNIHNPGCGVGGPCLPKDPYLLLAGKQPTAHSIIRYSRHLNASMESHVVSKVLAALETTKKNVNHARISVLGVAYKKASDDSTNAPAKSIIRALRRRGAEVTVYDPHCPESFGGIKCKGLYEAIAHTDCVLILTDHAEFASLDLARVKEIMNAPACIVDGRRLISPAEATSAGILYFGVGLGKNVNSGDPIASKSSLETEDKHSRPSTPQE